VSRLLGITYPNASTVSFTYDIRGRRITSTDQNSKTTTYTYDDADRLTAVTDPASHTTQYGYDTEDNLISITDANGHTTQFAYNPRGWVTQTTFPSSLTESYTYDLVGTGGPASKSPAQNKNWLPRPCAFCKGGIRTAGIISFCRHRYRDLLARKLRNPASERSNSGTDGTFPNSSGQKLGNIPSVPEFFPEFFPNFSSPNFSVHSSCKCETLLRWVGRRALAAASFSRSQRTQHHFLQAAHEILRS